MTIEEIQRRIEEIRKISADNEMAHVAEDELYADFIAYVASLENASLSDKARAVLETQDINFYRWYA